RRRQRRSGHECAGTAQQGAAADIGSGPVVHGNSSGRGGAEQRRPAAQIVEHIDVMRTTVRPCTLESLCWSVNALSGPTTGPPSLTLTGQAAAGCGAETASEETRGRAPSGRQ